MQLQEARLYPEDMAAGHPAVREQGEIQAQLPVSVSTLLKNPARELGLVNAN